MLKKIAERIRGNYDYGPWRLRFGQGISIVGSLKTSNPLKNM